MKKKILLVVTNSFCANLIKGQSNYLKERGFEVTIMSGLGPEMEKLVETEGVRHISVEFSKDINVFQDLKCLFKVISELKKLKPDVINAGNPKPGLILSIAALFFPKIYMVFTLRGLRSDTLKGSKKVVVTFMEKLTCKLAKKTIVISPSLSEHAIQRGVLKSSKSVVFGIGSSNGVNENLLYDSPVLHEKLLKQNKPFDFTFLYMGRMVKDKGISELIEAFKLLALKFNVNLVLVGPEEKEDSLSASVLMDIESHTSIFRHPKTSTVLPYFNSSDALILYSYREGFGNVVIEAAINETPSIVADIPGLKDTTAHFQTGMVIKPQSVIELYNAMEYFVLNKEKVQQWGLDGRKRALKNFSSDRIWNEMNTFYKQILSLEK